MEYVVSVNASTRFRCAVLAGVSGIAIAGALGGSPAQAQTTTISTSVSSSSALTSGTSLSITSTGMIAPIGADGITMGSNVPVGVIQNDGLISVGSSNNGIYGLNNNTISSITNTGTITGGVRGVRLDGAHITSITNSGTIQGTSYAMLLRANAQVGTVTNTGLISSASGYAVYLETAGSQVGQFVNSGTISGGNGLYLAGGTLPSLTNSGVIKGTATGGTDAAVYLNASSGVNTITNTGTIMGAIRDQRTTGLTIAGGSGSTYGTLMGTTMGSAGSIVSLGSVTFTGNTFLADNISAAAGTSTVTNTGMLLTQRNTAITGAYSQGSTATLVIGVVSTSSYGALTASGSVSLVNGSIVMQAASGGTLAAGTYTIASGGTVGTDYTGVRVTATGFTAATSTTIVGSTNKLLVTLTAGGGSGAGYATKGATIGGVAAPVGATLDNIRAGASPAAVAFQNSVLTVIDDLPAAAQGNAMKQLAPTQNAPSLQMSQSATAAVLGAVEQHQQSAMAYVPETGLSAGAEAHNSAVWGQFLGGHARRGTNSEADGYTLQNFGMAAGLDHLLTPNTMGGVALSWVRAWSQGSDNSSGSSSTLDSYQVTFYGTHRMGQAFVDGQLGAGWNHFDQNRAINFLGSTASATYDGQQYLAKATFGYDVPLVNGMTVTPLAGLRWLRGETSSYEETGAGAANLTVDAQGTNTLTQDIGAKVGWGFATGLGAMKTEARLAWVHDYTNGPIATSGLMGGQTFAVTTPRTEADGVRIGLAATLNGDDDLSMRVEYDGEMRAQYQSHTGMIKVIGGF